MQIISLIFNKNDEVSSLTEDIKIFTNFYFKEQKMCKLQLMLFKHNN